MRSLTEGSGILDKMFNLKKRYMKKTLIEALNNILEIIKKDLSDAEGKVRVDPERLEAFAPETSYLAERMSLTPFQAILFAVIIQDSATFPCHIEKIGETLGMSYLRLLSYSEDLYALRNRGFIRFRPRKMIEVPEEVIDALMKDELFCPSKTETLSDDDDPDIMDVDTVSLTDCENKPTKKMYYNQEERNQVGRLEAILDEDSIRKIFERMKENGLRTGITYLFYGAPGTGKTETVYQLAKQSGRKIMEVDVAKLRDSYVGETEKNVRELFVNYRTACSENDRMPILLFNEADAILGKRMDGAVKAIDRMENSVQNILLQELESFSGILIATTNLEGNLDTAFERRFLFKVRFSKPGKWARGKIWKAQFREMPDAMASTLAAEFQLSGGQIENIARKYLIDNLLFENQLDLDTLRQLCREETKTKAAVRKKIGFCQSGKDGDRESAA